MFVLLLGDSKENLAGWNPAASQSALLQADGPHPEPPKPTIAAVGVSDETAVALGRAMSDRWNRLLFDDVPSFLTFSRQTPVDCVVAELGRSAVSAPALHQEWSVRDRWATTVLLAENTWPDDLSRFCLKGAVRLLRAPWEEESLRRTIDEAQREGAAKRAAVVRRRRTSECLARLTPFERQVVECLYLGHPHKRIASRLGVSLRMVDYRRKCALRKLEVKTLADLVRVLAELEFADG